MGIYNPNFLTLTIMVEFYRKVVRRSISDENINKETSRGKPIPILSLKGTAQAALLLKGVVWRLRRHTTPPYSLAC